MSGHVLVLTTDDDEIARLAQAGPIHEEAWRDCICMRIECLDPATCEGWIACSEPHPGFEPTLDEVWIHGALHTWRPGHGWTVSFIGCVVDAVFEWDSVPAEIPMTPGRYAVATEWDDTDLTLIYVGAATSGDEVRA